MAKRKLADPTPAPPRSRRADERVSLHPLTFEEALGALLTVDPRKDDEQEGGDDGDGS